MTRWFWWAASAVLLLPFPAAAADALKPPFHLRQPAPLAGNEPCPAPPPAVVELSVDSKYGNNGPLHDTVDVAADAKAKAQMAPLRTFSSQVVLMANRYTKTGDATVASCALTWFDAWAGAHALTKMEDHNAWFEQGAAIGGLSLALAQISPAVGEEPGYIRAARWLHEAVTLGMHYFDSTPQLQGSRNNHLYWAALAAAGTAVVNNDRTMLDWAVEKYKTGVCSATAEGGLPLELERGSKALDYHFFAVEALIPVAAIAEANGIPTFDDCNGALHRIVRFSLDSLTNPARVEKLAGKKQDAYPDGMPSPSKLAWMEIYSRHFPGRAPMEKKILSFRPLSSTNIGGDQTLLYAH